MLRLHHQFINHSAQHIYLLNQLWDTVGTNTTTGQSVFRVSPNRVNIEVRPDRVSVSQSIPEIPFGLLAEAPYMPLMVCVASGAAYTCIVELPVPLLPYNAYERDSPTGPLIMRSLHVGLGYIIGLPHVEQAIHQTVTTTG
jgi:hypothetical protein